MKNEFGMVLGKRTMRSIGNYCICWPVFLNNGLPVLTMYERVNRYT